MRSSGSTSTSGPAGPEVPILEEQHTSILPLRPLHRLNPLTPPQIVPQRSDKPPHTILDVTAIVLPHDRLDGLSSFIGVVEGDGADVVVQHVRFDDAVEELAANKPELAVDGGGGTAGVVPGCGGVVWE